MAKNYPYFKFMSSDWLTGNIVYEDLCLQGLFINICALYWQRDGCLSVDEIKKRYKYPELVDQLIERFVHVKNGKVSINFLDEQFKETKKISKIRSASGSIGASKKIAKKQQKIEEAHKDMEANDLDSSKCLANAKQMPEFAKAKLSNKEEEKDKSKIREDKKRKIKKEFSPPSISEFKVFFQENGFRPEVAERAWNGYQAAAWNDSSGKPVLNWKQKCFNVWFTDENKISDIQPGPSQQPLIKSKTAQMWDDMGEFLDKLNNETKMQSDVKQLA